ncbi:MAG: HAMP domain-containing protein [Cellulosilyticum sp.]|nr:HAMP domain-containing protein [Cellulosilyticum sp.]
MLHKKRKSMSHKLVLIFLYTSFITLLTHFMTYSNTGYILDQLDSVYVSNTQLTELAECVSETQSNMYTYLGLKGSEDLKGYYESTQNLKSKMKQLNNQVTDSKSLMMEYHIREILDRYLTTADEAVQAKRGRNIKGYNASYEEASQLADYIYTYIESLNSMQLKTNTQNYLRLRQSLERIQLVSTVILIGMIGLNAFILLVIARAVTKPLICLSKTANEIAEGNFEMELNEIQTGDEVEILSKAFNKMIISIREYIDRLRKSMEIESEMKANELKMENYLKDAKLKYLQAQVNPHFLFNTLNAGMQLAIMEDAEQTSTFIENMAEFFRYSLKKGNDEVTIEDELALVDHYIYILNVRFCGEICYKKEVDENFFKVRVPGMILQPIVENVFQYGIRDIDYQGIVIIRVYGKSDWVYIEVEDNGRGMTEERIREVLEGTVQSEESCKSSNGIGLGNVMTRLKLYYGIDQVMQIESSGSNQGTKVILTIPLKSKMLEGE